MTKVTAESLKKVTVTLLASGAKFNTAMQGHICNILVFAYGEGNMNFSPATDLIEKITRKADRQAIQGWFVKHGNMVWRQAVIAKGKTKAKPAGFAKGSAKDFAFNLELSQKDLWFVDPVNADGSANEGDTTRKTKYDLPKRLSTMVDSLEDILVDKVEGDNIPEFLVKGLRTLMHDYEIYAKGQAAIAAEEAAKNTPPVTPEAPKAETPEAPKVEAPKETRRRTSGNKERERLAALAEKETAAA